MEEKGSEFTLAVTCRAFEEGSDFVRSFVQDFDHNPVVQELGESNQGHADGSADQVFDRRKVLRVLEPLQDIKSL